MHQRTEQLLCTDGLGVQFQVLFHIRAEKCIQLLYSNFRFLRFYSILTYHLLDRFEKVSKQPRLNGPFRGRAAQQSRPEPQPEPRVRAFGTKQNEGNFTTVDPSGSHPLFLTTNKCLASSNKCLTGSNKKLLTFFYFNSNSFLLLPVRHLLLLVRHLFLLALLTLHPCRSFRIPPIFRIRTRCTSQKKGEKAKEWDLFGCSD